MPKSAARAFVCKLCGAFSKQLEKHFAETHPNTEIATHPAARCHACKKPLGLASLSEGFRQFCDKGCFNSFKLRYVHRKRPVPTLDRIPYADTVLSNIITEAAPLAITWQAEVRMKVANVPVNQLVILDDGRTLAISERGFYGRPNVLAEEIQKFDPLILQGMFNCLNVGVVLTPAMDDPDLWLRVEQSRHYSIGATLPPSKLLDTFPALMRDDEQQVRDQLASSAVVEWFIYLPIIYMPAGGGAVFCYKLRGENTPRLIAPGEQPQL